ncbi:Hypothetical predicted protein [Mytilus galloprovincialis]|uniref:Uncharacterized protein n=1 Tax=Mytilus galloprovincialis TaxID=29158 RepID=A0A8B6FHK5_MYTGA|nr:Hypothetical predicted protein [Mytilus galloprovincialis]
MAVKMMNLLLMLIVAVNVQNVYSSNRITDIDMSMKNNLETEQYSKEFLKALHSLELYIQHESNKLDSINDEETDMQENDTIENQKRPFVRGGATRGYKFGKRGIDGFKQDTNIKSLLSEVNFVDNDMPRDQYKYTDDSLNDFQINHAVKRPFVLGNFKFGKRSLSEMYPENDDAVYFGEPGYGTEGKMPFVINSRQPFVLHGFDFVKPRTNTDVSSIELKRPLVFTSGYSFGKGQQQNDAYLEENKRPFVLSGGYELKKRGVLHDQPLESIPRYEENSHIVKKDLLSWVVMSSSKQRDTPNTENRNIKRHHAMLFQGESQAFPLEITQKESFGRTPGELFQDMPKRSFSFRHDYLFSKIRNEAKSGYRQLPFDNQIRAEKSLISNSPQDNISFQSVKRPFTTSGNYKSRIGKRPFVLSGRRMRYKFGK